jgi:hypothetical protein
MHTGHELIIADPLNTSNNVGRSTYQFVNIKVNKFILNKNLINQRWPL